MEVRLYYNLTSLTFYTVGWLQRRLSVTFTVTGRGAISLLLSPKHINSLVKFVSNSTTELRSCLRS